MSGEIKGITIELNGDTTKFNKAIKDIEKESKTLQSQLKSVNAALKLDPTNTDLIAQKQRLLTTAVNESKTALDQLKKAKADADAQMASGAQVNQEQYDKLTREIVFTESKLKSLTKQSAEFSAQQSGIYKVGDSISKVGEKASVAGDKVKGLSVAATGLLTALGGAAVKAAKSADDINTMAKVTGLSTAEIQKFQYASERIDVSIDTLTGSMTKLTRNMQTASKGTGDAYKAFKELNVEIQNQDGSLRDKQDVFDDIVTALGKMENETQRDALAMAVFGKSAQELNPLILGGADALKQYGQEAEDAGIILSQDALDGANELADAIDKLKATATASIGKVGSQLANNLTPIIENATKALVSVTDAFSKLSNGQQQAIIKTLAVTAAASPLIKTFGSITSGIGSLLKLLPMQVAATNSATAAQTGLNVAMNANPVGLVIAGVTALVGILGIYALTCDESKQSTEGLRKEFEQLQNAKEQATQDGEKEISVVKRQAERYEELRSKVNLTASEKAELKDLAEQLQKSMPQGISLINEETGAYNSLKGSIDDVIKSLRLKVKLDAGYDEYAKALEEIDAAKEKVDNFEKSLKNAKKTGQLELDSGLKNITEATQGTINQAQTDYDEAKLLYNNLYNTVSDYEDLLGQKYEKSQADISNSTADYYEQLGKDQLEQTTKTFEELEAEIERNHTRGIISDDEYYTKKDALLVKYNKQSLEEYDSFYGSLKSYHEKSTSSYLKTEEKTLTDAEKISQDKFKSITDDYKSASTEIQKEEKQLEDKLSSASLFNREKVGENDNVVVLTNFKEETEKLEQYKKLLSELDTKGISDSMKSSIKSMGVDDAVDYMNTLLTSENADTYIQQYEDYLKKANEVAESQYTDEEQQLQEDFKGKITSIMAEMPDTALKQGYDTATSFMQGLQEGLKNVNGIALSASNSSMNVPTQAQITAPVQQTQATTPQKITVQVPVNLNGKQIAEVVVPEINNMSYNQGKSVIN